MVYCSSNVKLERRKAEISYKIRKLNSCKNSKSKSKFSKNIIACNARFRLFKIVLINFHSSRTLLFKIYANKMYNLLILLLIEN